MRFLFLFLSLFLVSMSQGQNIYIPTNNIPVSDFQANNLEFAWNGGMNNPQISGADMNQDGNLDLVIFDRNDESFSVYINNGTPNQVDYRYAPEYNSHFDSCACSTWTLLVDYNQDGREDIFCGTQTGALLVYDNVLYPEDSVGFELSYNPLLSLYNTVIPLAIPKTDVPAILDMDGDGDIDILGSQNVFTTMAFHRNMAVENFGRTDTMDFVRETACWGHFVESNNDNTLSLFDTTNCPLPSNFDPNCLPEKVDGGRINPPTHISSPRHAGTTLLSLDLNGDGLNDLLLGDVSFNSVVATYNGGCVDYAFMDSVETDFPQAGVPVDVAIFPAMFYQDINNDGIKDLLSASNEPADGENVRGLVWYRNDGQTDQPDFQFQGRSFIVSDHIDMGRFSAPCFFDYDEDGLMDLVVGHGSARYRTPGGSDIFYELRLYRNTGNSDEAQYSLADSNFLNLASQPIPLTNVVPASGDLDNDGDDDILLGYQQGKIAYYENASGIGQDGVYVKITQELTDASGTVIDIGNLSAPELYDFDGDNDLDLFIGEEHGWINYYENTGTPQQFAFTQVSDTFGNIKLSNIYGSKFSGNSKPRIADFDQDGEAELFVGGDQGFLELYENIQFGLVSQLVPQTMPFHFDFGSFSAPALAVIDSSGDYSFVVGNSRGGLQLIRKQGTGEPAGIDLTADDPLGPLLFPNPTEGRMELQMRSNSGQSYRLDLRNSMGQPIFMRQSRASRLPLDLSQYPAGIYFLRIDQGEQAWLRKIVIQ